MARKLREPPGSDAKAKPEVFESAGSLSVPPLLRDFSNTGVGTRVLSGITGEDTWRRKAKRARPRSATASRSSSTTQAAVRDIPPPRSPQPEAVREEGAAACPCAASPSGRDGERRGRRLGSLASWCSFPHVHPAKNSLDRPEKESFFPELKASQDFGYRCGACRLLFQTLAEQLPSGCDGVANCSEEKCPAGRSARLTALSAWAGGSASPPRGRQTPWRRRRRGNSPHKISKGSAIKAKLVKAEGGEGAVL